MGQSAGAGPSGATPAGGNNSSGGFGRFNMAAIQPSGPGLVDMPPPPASMFARPNVTSGQIGAASNPQARPAVPMGDVTFGRRPDPSLISTRPGAPMSLSGTAGPRPFMAQPPMSAMSTPNLNAPMYGRQAPMPSSFASRLSALRGGMFGIPSNAVRFAEGGSTSSPSAQQMALGQVLAAAMFGGARQQGAPQSSGVYRPTYKDYGAPVQAAREAAGLGATPQYAQFQMQMPTFDRPGVTRDTRLERPVPYNPPSQEQQLLNKAFNTPFFSKLRGTPERQAKNLNKAITNRSLTEAQYNLMSKNPELYLDYVKRVQAGEAPTTIGYSSPRANTMMTAAQRDAYNKKIARELDELIRPITVFEVQDYGGA